MMLITDAWVALAAGHGVEFATPARHGADVALAGPGLSPTDYDLTIVPVLHPSRVSRWVEDGSSSRLLVVAHAASPAARAAAERAGLSLLVTGDRGPVRGALFDTAGRITRVHAPLPGEEPDEAGRHRPAPGPAPWGAVALVIELLADPRPRTQRELAARLDLTQGRVSQVLSHLDFVGRGPAGDGWVVRDVPGAAAWLTATYRRPRVSSGWLALAAPVPATRAIAELLVSEDQRYAVTGQVAADVLAPWASPTRSTIWVDRLVDLSPAGCTPAPAREASITVAVPDDPYALACAVDVGGLAVTDGWRTWITLALDGDDQAADHLLDRLTTR